MCAQGGCEGPVRWLAAHSRGSVAPVVVTDRHGRGWSEEVAGLEGP